MSDFTADDSFVLGRSEGNRPQTRVTRQLRSASANPTSDPRERDRSEFVAEGSGPKPGEPLDRADHPPLSAEAFEAPGADSSRGRDAAPGEIVDVHLIGVGSVGRQLLWRLAGSRSHRLVGVTDSQVTLRDARGIDAVAVLRILERGGKLSEFDDAVSMPGEVAVDYVRASVVIDAAPADGRWRYHGVARVEAALRREARVVLLAAGPVGARALDWFRTGQDDRLWCNVPMDGAWSRLRSEREALRGAGEIQAIGDPRSSAWLDAVAQCQPPTDVAHGAPGLALAHRLSVAVQAVHSVSLDPLSIELPSLRDCDVEQLRDRWLRGRVTRLVGRWSPQGGARFGFEALALNDEDRADAALRSVVGTALIFEGLPADASRKDAGDRAVLVGRSAHDESRQAAAAAWADVLAASGEVVAERRRLGDA